MTTTIKILFPDIDECANVTCGNGGNCTDKINGFECTCVLGFTGELCETGEYAQVNNTSSLICLTPLMQIPCRLCTQTKLPTGLN